MRAAPAPNALLAKLEDELRRIIGVRSARVVGDQAPVEIHLVATKDRSPKQLVRDAQSLAAAGFGISIDHRIVSVVQLDEEEEQDGENAEELNRPVLERVVFASKGNSGWVKVALKWPEGVVTEGAGTAGPSREARARAAAVAVQQALDPVLTSMEASLDIDHIVVQRVGETESVLIRAIFHDGAKAIPLIGSAIIYDDVASASVRAMLQAVNRKLR